ncbi:MAG: flagellar hook assembly protein FlgD [Planctomycetota bacterium]|jgi:hypothetical protein
MRNRLYGNRTFIISGLAAFVLGCLIHGVLVESAMAVSSKIARHNSSADFLKGQIEDVVIGSKGTLQLGRAWKTPVEEFEDVWSIHSIVLNGGTIFIGTSPNGGIFKYSLGELTKIYSSESDENEYVESEDQQGQNGNEPNDSNTVEEKEHLANEHIFAMATDMAGRLLAGISGDKCRLLRFEADKAQTIFEPNDAKYIFAIAVDEKGNVYLGTGPEGKVYRLDPFDPAATGLVYDSTDKNILSLAVGKDGFVYAGSDNRGLIYRIDPRKRTATVLYDSDQPEVTALLVGEQGELYAATTSAEITQAETKFAAEPPLAGRPEVKSKDGKTTSQGAGGRKLQIPNTKKERDQKSSERKTPARPLPKAGKASFVYRITKDGYVTDVFSETVVLFCLAEQGRNLMIGTGNDAQLFTVDPTAEEAAVVYEDKRASQITAVGVSGDDIYIGTANPAKLVKLAKTFSTEGTYSSDLIDAGQPAKWGKLQVEADVPAGCTIMAASRSGNVKDVNDPTFSDWTEPVEVTGPVQLNCPLGRFCQYKLVLKSNGIESPLVREAAVASTVPNLAPKVEAVSVDRVEATGKSGVFKISYKAKDENDDKLIYTIDFRKLGRINWIELKDDLEADKFEWDGKTVEDGRYEVRVTANDERSNTTATKLTGARISDPVIVDNTAPVIKEYAVEKEGKTIVLKLRVTDEFSAIGKLEYTIDSNAKWKGTLPDDLVYDTTDESFNIRIEDLKAGEHIISVRVSDQVGNTMYKTFEVIGTD